MNDDFDFTGYNNQAPNDGQRPDYTYNSNGREHNNNNRRDRGRGIAIVVVCVVLVGLLITAAVIGCISAAEFFQETSDQQESVASGEQANDSADALEIISQPVDTEVSVPDFTPRTDVEKGVSDLTAIYEQASVSCCTIKSVTSSSGYSLGSGFVIDVEGGYIATNHHVISGARSITVTFYDGTTYDAKLIGSDATSDIAVLQIEAEGLTALPIGDSNSIKIGEQVMAIGTPYSEILAGTMTIGYISGIARDIEMTNSYGQVVKTMTLLQTDTSINPGNSGGPLIDMAGNVIGITSMKIMSEEYEGLGFAIPITEAVEIFEQIIAGKEVDGSSIATASPYLGVTIYAAQDGLDYYYIRPSCDYPEGVMVMSIQTSGSAYRAGLTQLDIITEFNGVKVTTPQELKDELAKYKAGQEVSMTMFRFNRSFSSGEYVTITFKLDAAA